jgi:hypothetical protein
MESERRLLRKILYVIRGLQDRKPNLTDIEFVYKDGLHVGFKIEITAKPEKKTVLKIVRDEDKD